MSDVASRGVALASPPTRATVLGIAAAAALVPLNSTMIAVALPDIAAHFDASVGAVSVLVTVYLVAMLVGQPLAGWIGDRVGNRTTVVVALSGVAACSLLAAAAPTLGLLVGARALQAMFAAALGPSVQSTLRAVTPPADRGRTFGILGSVIAVGAAAGPIVGGGLVEIAGWRAIFVINVPIAAVALASSLGAGTAGAAVAAGGPPPPDGAIVNPVFAASFVAQALSTQGQYALLLLAPMILVAQGWSAASTGLALAALTIGMIVTGPPGGRAGDRHGRRAPVVGGMGLAAAAIAVAAAGGTGIAPVVLVAALAAFGLGLGFAVPSLMTAALESVPEGRTASAAGVLATSRYVGSITTSVAISVLVTGEAAGSRTVLTAGAVTMLVACIVAGRLPGRHTQATEVPAAA